MEYILSRGGESGFVLVMSMDSKFPLPVLFLLCSLCCLIQVNRVSVDLYSLSPVRENAPESQENIKPYVARTVDNNTQKLSV